MSSFGLCQWHSDVNFRLEVPRGKFGKCILAELADNVNLLLILNIPDALAYDSDFVSGPLEQGITRACSVRKDFIQPGHGCGHPGAV